MSISSDEVVRIFRECLFKDDELVDKIPQEPYITVEGIIFAKLYFRKSSLENYRQEISSYIDDIMHTGRDMRIYSMCIEKSKRQWSTSDTTTEILVLLGLGLGIIEYSLPRDTWEFLPKGIPFVQRKK